MEVFKFFGTNDNRLIIDSEKNSAINLANPITNHRSPQHISTNIQFLNRFAVYLLLLQHWLPIIYLQI
ncbi:uncharacterized protein ASCRUDRAFT_76030 [Ascoidea rubescens DSM 1968]|uniref:Uncharacterized protein n=1 Tax=Ascoidea rubescens DSM 1968 TaxID=1344418 RepID=A0A1D2VG33_9ASCO|nr:hypothetical protein ASCRUDRAFT_76030 [Ascoidea rubescens DSM 1968]ODV60638.1 hypothetical protein ASCRUDRAFT_76030 [Ascoidea rubescens DSM 1968]